MRLTNHIYVLGCIHGCFHVTRRYAPFSQRVHVAHRVIPTQQNNIAHSIKCSCVSRQMATDSAFELFHPSIYFVHVIPYGGYPVSLTRSDLFINTLMRSVHCIHKPLV